MKRRLQILEYDIQILNWFWRFSGLLSRDDLCEFAQPVVFVVGCEFDGLIDLDAQHLCRRRGVEERNSAVGIVLEEAVDSNEGALFLLLEVKLFPLHLEAVRSLGGREWLEELSNRNWLVDVLQLLEGLYKAEDT
jgi:hypothetical protein